jgi:predicted permease
MSLRRGWRRWLRLWRDVPSEVEDEIGFHLDMRARENEASGMDAERARRVAEARFGDVARIRRTMRKELEMDVTSERRRDRVVGVGRDVRHAVRLLKRNPSWSVIAVLTLALGIGANTAMFGAVSAILLRPLPYREADRLYSLWLDDRASLSPTQWLDLRDNVRTMEAVGAWSGWSFTLTGDGGPEVLSGAVVSANLFGMLGVRAALGRGFVAEDAVPSPGTFPWEPGIRAVALSHGLWQRRWGGDPSIVGQTIVVDGRSIPVVAVMPQGFEFPTREAEMWRVVPENPTAARSTGGALQAIGRLRSGIDEERILPDLQAAAVAMRAAYPVGYDARTMGRAPGASSFKEDRVREVKPALLVLFGAVGFVLLIACANVANLLLAQSAVRQREMAIRASMGAARGRLVSQVLTECAVLAFVGGLVGLGVAAIATDLMNGLLPAEILPESGVSLDVGVLAFTIAVSLLAGLLFGAVPAMRASRPALQTTLREGGRGGLGRERLRTLNSLVVGEIALALVLVTGAGLALRSFWTLSRQDPGFDANGVLSMRVAPSDARYATRPQRVAFWDDVLTRIQALPDVRAAAGVHLLPLGGSNWNSGLRIEGRPAGSGEVLPEVDWRVVTTDFFATMDIPLREGRLFEAADRAGALEVALVNETLVRRLFTGSPIGARVRTPFEAESTWVTIVGIVGDTKDMSLAGAARPQIYRPYGQYSLAALTLMVRTNGDPTRIAAPVRDAIRAVDADVPVGDVQPLTHVVAASISQPRLLLVLLLAFGGLALLLGGIGVYGVLSYVVTRRRPEFGVRLALGATPSLLQRSVLLVAMRMVGTGLAIGLAGAFAVTRLLSSQLFGVQPTDPATFIAVSVVLGVVALAAAWVPARRASRALAVSALTMDG